MYIPFLFVIAAGAAPLRVVIDAGHGGRDRGAVVNHVAESELTLDVARRLHRLLDADPSFRARLTRDADERLTLAGRTRLAREWNADLFVSVHVNSSPDPRAHGAEFYFQNQLPADEESAYLAHREDELERAPTAATTVGPLGGEVAAIITDLLDGARVLRSSRLTTALRSEWRGPRKGTFDGIRQAPFFVLSQIDVPSALVELGYLTNADDERRLRSGVAREAMARDLHRGLQRYRESITQGHASRQP